MDAGLNEASGRRIAATRRIFGRPGSVRRWLAASLVFLAVCAALWVRTGWLTHIAIFLVATIFVLAAFRARFLVIGDEDELRAGLRQQARMHEEELTVREPKILVDAEEWQRGMDALAARSLGFEDAEVRDAPRGQDQGEAAPHE